MSTLIVRSKGKKKDIFRDFTPNNQVYETCYGTFTVVEGCKKLDLDKKTVWGRLARGCDPDRAFFKGDLRNFPSPKKPRFKQKS
jgi:hypothetical protein